MSNRITIIKGTAVTFLVDVLGPDGNRLVANQLLGATAELELRVDPNADPITNLLHFTTADAAHLAFVGLQLRLAFLAADTTTVPLATYNYQVKVTLFDGTVLATVPWAPAEVVLGGTAAPVPPTFDNQAKVDHDFGGPDALRYITAGGSPVDAAQVRLYYKSDYTAGKLDTPIGVTLTNAFGRWVTPILVISGFTYVVQFFKPNEFGPDTAEFTA